jgi:hypothetical protein
MELTGKQLVSEDEVHPGEQPSLLAEHLGDMEPAMD